MECGRAPFSPNHLSFGDPEKTPAGALPSLWPLKTAASSIRLSAKRPPKYSETRRHKKSIPGEVSNRKPDELFGAKYTTEFENSSRIIASMADLKLYVSQNVYPQPDTKLGLIFLDNNCVIQAEYFVSLEEDAYLLTHVIAIAAKSLFAKKIHCVQFTEFDPNKSLWINRVTDRLIPAVNRTEIKIMSHVVVYGRLILVRSK